MDLFVPGVQEVETVPVVLEVPSEPCSLTSAETDGAAETLEESGPWVPVQERAGVQGEGYQRMEVAGSALTVSGQVFRF